MQVLEAYLVWASAVANDDNFTDHQLLEGAVGTLFQPLEAGELWQVM